jgi:hypothetical protein
MFVETFQLAHIFPDSYIIYPPWITSSSQWPPIVLTPSWGQHRIFLTGTGSAAHASVFGVPPAGSGTEANLDEGWWQTTPKRRWWQRWTSSRAAFFGAPDLGHVNMGSAEKVLSQRIWKSNGQDATGQCVLNSDWMCHCAHTKSSALSGCLAFFLKLFEAEKPRDSAVLSLQ